MLGVLTCKLFVFWKAGYKLVELGTTLNNPKLNNSQLAAPNAVGYK